MSDTPPPNSPPPADDEHRHDRDHPKGDPESLIVEGILDGRVEDAAQLRAAVDRLSATGAGEFRVDVAGGRFSLLPVDTHVSATAFGVAEQATFLDRLTDVIDAATPGSIETNLRCRLVYDDEVAETVFVVRGQAIEPITRIRPRLAGDAPVVPQLEPDGMLGIRRRELLWVTPVLLLVGVVLAWQTGWIDRVLAARAETLTTDTGPFGDMLSVAAVRSWGDYEITLRRGPGYPATPDELASRRDASASLTERAACEVVGNGGQMFVRLVDADAKVLAEGRVELRQLLESADGEATLGLPGQISASGITLAMSLSKQSK